MQDFGHLLGFSSKCLKDNVEQLPLFELVCFKWERKGALIHIINAVDILGQKKPMNACSFLNVGVAF